MPSQKQGDKPDKDCFTSVSRDKDRIYYIYQFQRPLVDANSAKPEHFCFCVPKPQARTDQLLLLPLHSKIKVELSFQYVYKERACEIRDRSASASYSAAVDRCEEIFESNFSTTASKTQWKSVFESVRLEPAVKRRLVEFSPDDYVHAAELTNNNEVRAKVTEVLTPHGFTVIGNVANLLGDYNHRTSRFYSSRPDLVIFHKDGIEAAVINNRLIVNDDDDDCISICAAATESKQVPKKADAQLYAGMEKLAGEIAWNNLTVKGTLFKKNCDIWIAHAL